MTQPAVAPASTEPTVTESTAAAVASDRAAVRAVRRERLLIGAGVVAVLVAAWFVVTGLGLVRPISLPSPARVWQAFVSTETTGFRGHKLHEHLFISLGRVLIALAIALVTAVPLGILAGTSRRFESVLDPVINFLRVLPPLAYLPLLIIWLGIGETARVTLLTVAAFPPLFISLAQGVRRIPATRLDAARMLGARGFRLLRSVVLPSVLPDLFTGLRVAVGFTYTTVVAAEIIAADSGIGWMTLSAYKFLQSDVVWVGMLVMGLTGVALDGVVRFLQRRLVPWQGRV